MKKFRKLIPAFCMLLISAVLLGTSTYAWFSMNTSVTASGLSVTAKADYIYLLVGESSTTLTSTNAKATMQGSPANYGQDITLSSVDNTTLAPSTPDTAKVTNATTAAVPGNWYTASSTAPDASQPNSTKDKTDLTAGNFAEYVIKKTLFVTLANGSKATENTLKVTVTLTATDTATGETTTIDAVKVLVANIKNGTAGTAVNATSDTAVTIGTITDADLVQLDFYIYYDGKDDSVYTNNFANLDGASVQIVLTVE